MKTAAGLKPGESGTIDRLAKDPVSLKLLELGCLPGRTIRLIRKAPSNNPLYFTVGSLNLALRREEAEQILLSDT